MDKETLFIGLGSSAPAWYRCALPANALEQDWVGTIGVPPEEGEALIAGNFYEYPDIPAYDNIVIQQPGDDRWLEFIKKCQKNGQRVFYEVDDFVHGVHKIEGHTNQKQFHKKKIRKMVECMKACDGMIVSTDFLAEQYKKYNSNIHVCKVGIDTARYEVEFPQRSNLVIGWGGGTGHHLAVGPWLEVVSQLLSENPTVAFASIGTRYASALGARHPGQTLDIPWTSIENYPYALSNIDIIIAPTHDSKYYKAKSDLRWLEASAVGIPTVASPTVYKEIEEEVTGLLAETPDLAYEHLEKLIDDPALRKDIGKQAQSYVKKHRDIRVAAKQWENILND